MEEEVYTEEEGEVRLLEEDLDPQVESVFWSALRFNTYLRVTLCDVIINLCVWVDFPQDTQDTRASLPTTMEEEVEEEEVSPQGTQRVWEEVEEGSNTVRSYDEVVEPLKVT